LQFLIGYLYNSYLVAQLFSYIFFTKLAILIGYTLIIMLFVTLSLPKKQLGIQEK